MRVLHRLMLALVVLVPWLTTYPVVAQDATSPVALGEPLGMADCQFTPRPVNDILALWYPDPSGSAVGSPGRGWNPFPRSLPLELGTPADAQTVEAVTQVLRRFVACDNSGDFWRRVSLASDTFTFAFSPGEVSREEALAKLERGPKPAPASQQWSLAAVTDVSVMDDGRVAAILVGDDRSTTELGLESQVFYLVHERGQWRVDALASFSAD